MNALSRSISWSFTILTAMGLGEQETDHYTPTREPYLKILNKDRADHNLSSSDLVLNALR